MTRFRTIAPRGSLEWQARRLLAHIEAASERDGTDPPAEAIGMAKTLLVLDYERVWFDRNSRSWDIPMPV